MTTYELLMWYELSDWYQWAWEQGAIERLKKLTGKSMKKTTDIILNWGNLHATIRDGVLADTYITMNEERIGLFAGDVIDLAKNLNELVNYINNNDCKWYQ